MSRDKSTISGGLGISEDFFEEAKKIVDQNYKKYDTISDALEAIGEEVRVEALGECNEVLSDYERKLLLAGFLGGAKGTESKLTSLLNALKVVMLLDGVPVEVKEALFKKMLGDLGIGEKEGDGDEE
jgi:prenyltransferase beta subunit